MHACLRVAFNSTRGYAKRSLASAASEMVHERGLSASKEFFNVFAFRSGIVEECRRLAADAGALGPQLGAAAEAVKALRDSSAGALGVVLAGWPVDELSEKDIRQAYVGFGNHVGRVVDQSRDLGNNAINDVHARPGELRGSRSQCSMPMHTDAAGNERHHEFNALLCVQPSAGDGQTPFASADQIYEDLRLSDPGALDILARGFFYRHPGGSDVMPFTQERVPALRCSAGRVETFFAEKYVDKGRLTEVERAAMTKFVQAAENSKHVDMNWFRGDAVFWHNHRTLHGRRAYTDPARRLLRLWVRANHE